MKRVFHTIAGLIRGAQPLWRNRDFVLAGSARFIATAGMGAVIVSVMLHLQNLAAAGQTAVAGPWLVAAYLFCSALPLVLLAPWAGRLADTRDSRTLATASSVVSAAAVAGMGLGMQYLDNYLPVLFAMTFLLDTAQAVAGPDLAGPAAQDRGRGTDTAGAGHHAGHHHDRRHGGTGRRRAAQRLGRIRPGVCRGQRLLPGDGRGRHADPDPPRHGRRAGRQGQSRPAGRTAPDPAGRPGLGAGPRGPVLHHRRRGDQRP